MKGSRESNIYNDANYMQVRVYTANHTSGNAFTLFAYYGYVYNQAYAQGKKYTGQSVRSFMNILFLYKCSTHNLKN